MMYVICLCVLTFSCCLVASEPLRHREKRSGFSNIVYDSTWSQWGPCTAQCDGGTQQRTLGCKTANNNYNSVCMTTTATCNLKPCNDVYKWSSWEQCSTKCRPNSQTEAGIRSRYSTLQKGQQQTIHCNAQGCNNISGCGKADLLFVLDSSASVGELNWYRTKQFVLDVISGLTIGPDDTRVGVIIFSTEISVQVYLGQYGGLDELKHTIWDMPYMAGSTNTADALKQVRAMAKQYGRPEVKAVVVVVTDGESNILPETTSEEADLCRKDAITIFAIGVGLVNNDELQLIANKPTSAFYHYVEDYEALYSIVSTVVADTCETANQVQCSDWSQWGQCSVTCGGSGVQSRSRDCRMLDYYGSVLKSFSRTENRSCQTDACLVTELPVTDMPSYSSSSRPTDVNCSLCDFHDNTGYLLDLSDCSRYIECVKIFSESTEDYPLGYQRSDGGYSVYYRRCPLSMFWNQELLTCDRTPSLTGCTVIAPVISSTVAPSPRTEAFKCPFKRDAREPWRFYIEFDGRRLYQTCQPNMQFNEDICVCLGLPTAAPCDVDPLLYFPFDDDFNDVSCNKAKSDVYGNPVLTIDLQRKLGNVAYFNGTSRLTVGFLYNWFAGHLLNQWSVSVWYKRDREVTEVAGLVNNGDCKQGPSFALSVEKNDVIIGDITTDMGTLTVSQQTKISATKWQHVALVYHFDTLSLYVNGIKTSRHFKQHGYIANRQCPMNIAHYGLSSESGFFNGYLDELRIYSRSLTEYEVQDLYTKS